MIDTTTAAAILGDAEVNELVIQPVLKRSVPGQALTVHTVPQGLSSSRFPILREDPSAAWVAEGQEIPVSDAEFAELEVFPKKLTGLTVVTHEAAMDTRPDAPQVVGAGLVRDLARKIDAAFFTDAGANAPAGLASLTPAGGVHEVTLAAWEDVHGAAVDAVSAIEGSGSTATSWLFNPADLAAIAKVTEEGPGGSRRPLLGSVTGALGTVRSLLGVEIVVSDQQPRGVAYAIDKAVTHLAIWDGTEVRSDESIFFTSDRIAVRARVRLAFAFPHPAGIARITLPTPEPPEAEQENPATP